MNVEFDSSGEVALVTGTCGALGSAVVEAFDGAGAGVAACDVVDAAAENSLLDPDAHEGVSFHRADFTDESDVEAAVDAAVSEHGGLDYLLNVAGTWRGGDPVDETGADQFDVLFGVNLKTAFLATKHALPHLRESADGSDGGSGGAIGSVSARSGLEGGEGDAIYRATKAGVRILTESVAAENRGTVRANCVMPSVLDTPMNREMMQPSDDWVGPAEVARVVQFLCSDAAAPTSGAAVPVYGEA